MKYLKNIIPSLLVAFVTVGFTACSEDEFTETIFSTDADKLDVNSYTYAFDSYLRDNFQTPYNVKFIYRMEDIGSDMQKDLVPASFEKSKQFAVLCKFLWYDIYKELAGEKEVFLKKYSPRIIHVIGSPAFNSDGTMTLGFATNGTKVTLQAVNWLDPQVIEGSRGLNYMFFHTMHHEFTHILDQTISRPQAFNVLSNGLYNSDWNNTPVEVAQGNGFVTDYASASATEDWAETISNYITMNQQTWDSVKVNASYDWEQIEFRDDAQRDSVNRLYRRAVASPTTVNADSIGFLFHQSSGEYLWVRKSIVRDQITGKPIVDADGNIQYLHQKAINAVSIIDQKIELARQWMKDGFQIDLDALRDAVQKRQYMTDANGDFIMTTDGSGKKMFVNRLTQPDPDDPSQTLMDKLMKAIDDYAPKTQE